MRALVVYGTTEGHTARVARVMTGWLRGRGLEVVLCDAAKETPPDPTGFDLAVVAASLHFQRYQARVTRFATVNRDALNGMLAAFVSVSLSAAGDAPGDWAGLEACFQRFQQQTGWRPRLVHHAAGAMPFRHYGPLRKLAIAWIARRHGFSVSVSEDYDLTDYSLLASFLDDLVLQLPATPARAEPGTATASRRRASTADHACAPRVSRGSRRFASS